MDMVKVVPLNLNKCCQNWLVKTWYFVDMFKVVPLNLNTCCQNWLVKTYFLSETMVLGVPWSLTITLKKASATCLLV